ncbi:MAG TPA: MerC domain-containing protein [Caulobacter sp.]|nr:MerC domain-containing protein [Caulobacter sp.]
MAAPRALSRLFDASAIGLSGLCLVHCLGLPIAAAALPFMAAWAQAEWAHLAFLSAAAPISFLALLGSGGWRHGPTLGAALLGLALLTAGVLEWPGPEWEAALTLLGGLCLATAHLWNWKRHHHEP